MAERVIIFDTTLRDGEQAPGASLNFEEKLQVARALEELKVDVIEAGFPIASQGDFEAVKAIGQSVKKSIVCGLARSLKPDMDAVIESLKGIENSRIHIFLATSKIHMEYKLEKTEEQILNLAVESIKYAKSHFRDVEFSPEDASRTEKEFLFEVIEKAIEAGAATINIPDTVGYADPEEFGRLIKEIKEQVPNIGKAVISAHCHNDLGLALANSLAAVKNGARQIECTINGIGERAGNASLEEVVMNLEVRKDVFNDLKTNIDKKKLYQTSRLVSELTGFVVAPNKAIVGANAFRHEAGVHQHGILKKRETYEIIHGEDVGFNQSNIVLGKHSGRHAFLHQLGKLGCKLGQDDAEKAFLDFKNLADEKKEVSEEDLATILEKYAKHVD